MKFRKSWYNIPPARKSSKLWLNILISSIYDVCCLLNIIIPANKSKQTRSKARLFVLLGAQTTVRVGQTDRQLLGALDDVLALLRWDAMGDLTAVDAVLHQQHLQLLDVMDEELLEASRQHVTGAGVRSVTDVGHQVLALKATTHSVVNTLGLAPVGLNGVREDNWLACRPYRRKQNYTYCELGISVGLMADEALRALLHDRRPVRWSDGHFSCSLWRRERNGLDTIIRAHFQVVIGPGDNQSRTIHHSKHAYTTPIVIGESRAHPPWVSNPQSRPHGDFAHHSRMNIDVQ